MATAFFEMQDLARKNTRRLVLLFILSLIIIIGLTYLAVLGIFVYADGESNKPMPSLFQPGILLLVSISVLTLVGVGSGYKILQLSAGGKAVALLLGGQEIPSNTRNLRERRLLNIVEEMSIASGVPVPPVFLLPNEQGINAFAAGYAPGDAVVAVSQGCLTYLTRDEIQGVVAHEFSHILNGDMRLNIRLTGLIFGLVVISILGIYIMDTMSRSKRSSSSSNSKGANQIFFLGLVLYILGSLGAFFGELIQAAISRQREYLADASAVQFTRNPDGIAGALKKIGGLAEGSVIEQGHAQEISHMFFADGIRKRIIGLLATHPPLADRIRQLDPAWDGKYPSVHPVAVNQAEAASPKKASIPPKIPGMPTLPGIPQVPAPVILGLHELQTAERVGTITPETLQAAERVREAIPEILTKAAQNPFSARALVYGLLLDSRPNIREKQLRQLAAGSDAKDVQETQQLIGTIDSLSDFLRLPLLELSIPALREMSPGQHQAFRKQVQLLIDADKELSVFEYALSTLLGQYLDEAFQPTRRGRARYKGISAVLEPIQQVLSFLAWHGQENEGSARAAYLAGMRAILGDGDAPEFLQRTTVPLSSFDQALLILREGTTRLRRSVVQGCIACVAYDQEVTLREAELLRVIGARLDCPLPILNLPHTA